MTQLVGENLAFDYEGSRVLHGVNVSLSPGKVVALVGPSGSGKTTLLWLLAGLLQPHAGRVCVCGAADSNCPNGQPISQARPTMGMVFQQPALWEHLTVEQHLDLVLAGRKLARHERHRRIDDMLERMHLQALAHRRPGQLSGGERQRVAISRALVVNPEWLLLDEPLAHLDGPSRSELFDFLQQMLANTTAGVMIASHNAIEALRIAHEMVVLQAGNVLQAGPCEDVYRHPVDLVAARALAPAWELEGIASDGTLYAGDKPVLEGIHESLSGPTRLILRASDVRFKADPLGPAVVVKCQFAGDSYHLQIEVADRELVTESNTLIVPEMRGRLCLKCL